MRVDGIVSAQLASPRGYGVYLRGMHGFLAATRHAFAGGEDTWAAERGRLEADLRELDLAPLPPPPAKPVVAPAGDVASTLGWEYVVAGASLGARYLMRAAAGLGYSAESGASFLAGHACGDGWRRFLGRLERESFSERELARACASAQSAFHAAETAFIQARQEAPA